MPAWANFFLGELGASATLTGLVFVAVSINLSKIMVSTHLPSRALEALVALITVLFTSSLMLIPDQPLSALGIEVLAVGVISGLVVVYIQVTILRRIEPMYRLSFLIMVGLYELAIVLFLVGGVSLLVGQTAGLYWVVAATLTAFLAAFADAWVLMIEINR